MQMYCMYSGSDAETKYKLTDYIEHSRYSDVTNESKHVQIGKEVSKKENHETSSLKRMWVPAHIYECFHLSFCAMVPDPSFPQIQTFSSRFQ